MAKACDVASIRFAVGYDSRSQFNREYIRLVGALRTVLRREDAGAS